MENWGIMTKEKVSPAKCCASRKTVFARDASILVRYMNNTLLIGWKRVHSLVTPPQSFNTSANYKQHAHTLKTSSALTFLNVFFMYIIYK